MPIRSICDFKEPENVMGILMMQMVIWQLMRKRRKMSD
jgi:hypothetical protein